MSFDVFFQRFRDGEAAPGGSDRMEEVLRPWVVSEEPQHRFLRVRFGDGEVDVYLSGDSMMANHVSGADPWELLVQGAHAAGWVILPVGCAPCITDEEQRGHLPDGMEEDAILIRTGADLLETITSA